MNFQGYGFGARVLQGEDGIISSGDGSTGAQVIGTYYAGFANAGRVSVGDASVGADITAGTVLLRYGQTTATPIVGALIAVNDGIIETGDNSVGVRMNGVQTDVPYSGRWLLPDPEAPYGYSYVDIAGEGDVTSASYLLNSGTIRTGANSTAVSITGTAASEQGLHLFNVGTIRAGQDGSGTALAVNADNGLGSYVVNVGTLAGDILFGDGDDRLVHTLMVDANNVVTSSGVISMNGSLIDFGAGQNVFDIDQGTVSFRGDDNLITGADLVLNQANFESRDNVAGDALTIDGNVSGSLLFGADVSGTGEADQLFITGDVADGSEMRVVLNPTGQLSGETTLTLITVGGVNGADAPVIAGVTGNFADSLLGAEISFDESSGEVVVTAQFGMGHMATSAVSATTMAQNWWMQSLGSFDKRNLQKLAGAEDTGVSVWAAAFHEEGTYEPGNDLQDTSFDQKLSGLQTGVEWQKEVAGGSFTLGAMFSQGDASVNLNANVSSAVASASAYGVNASYSFKNGLYVNAAWQAMSMDVNLRTPGTFSAATGSTQAEGDGFNVEMGYAHRFGSGLTLLPQLQYASVDVELDDFSSSDDVYGLTEVGGRHSLLRAGVSLLKTFETTNGSITPVLDLSWLDALDGDSGIRSNGLQFTNDTSGSGLRAEFGIAGRYKAWDISGRVGLTDTQKSKQSLSTNLNVRYRW
jgi:outer membrane autotransporter protein